MDSSTFPQVRDYPLDIPPPPRTVARGLWASLFLLDFTVGLTARPNSEGHVVHKSRYPGAVGRWYRRLYDRLGRELEERVGEAAFEDALPVPSVAAEDWTRADFARWRREADAPLVIRGLLRDTAAVRTWSLDWLAENYGDRRVQCLNVMKEFERETLVVGENIALEEVRIRDFCTDDAYDGHYINNIVGVLDEQDFRRACRLDRVDSLRGYKHAFVQWFISRSTETGSTLHAANGDNLFMNLKGRKEWHMIPPQYSPWVLPALSRYAVYAVSELREFGLDDYERRYRDHPHLRSVPKFVAELEEGDVLYNPPWWWHDVRNRTPFTVGAAVRYPGGASTVSRSPTFNACQMVDLVKHPKRSFWSSSVRGYFSKDRAKEFVDSIFSGKG